MNCSIALYRLLTAKLWLGDVVRIGEIQCGGHPTCSSCIVWGSRQVFKICTHIVLVVATSASCFAEDLSSIGCLFHASFEKTSAPEFFAGRDPEFGIKNRGTVSAGVKGNGWQGRLTYRAAGNISAERGTIAFYAKRPHLEVYSREWGFYHWMFVVQTREDEIRPWVLERSGRARGAAFKTADVDVEQWHHYAMTWDRCFGTRFYVDGKLASQDWGEDRSWAQLLTPYAITARASAGIDELYVFDWTFGDDEVLAFSQGRLPDSRRLQTNVLTTRLVEELGFESSSLVEANASLVVEQVPILKAKSRTVTMTWVHDGRHHAAWPDVYTGEHTTLDIFPREDSFNFVSMEGRVGGVRLNAWDHITHTARPIFSVPFGDTRWVGRSVKEQTVRQVKLERPGHLKGEAANNTIQEVGFYRVTEEDVEPSVESITYFPGERSHDGLGKAGLDLLDCGRLKSPGPVRLGGREAAVSLRLQALAPVDCIGPEREMRLYGNGVHLDLTVESKHKDDVLEVVIFEPADSFREVLRFPVKLTFKDGSTSVNLALVRSGFIVDVGERFHISLMSYRGGLTILPGAKVTVIVGDPEQVLPEAIQDLAKVTHKMYSWAQEGRPWGLDFENQFLVGKYGKFSALELHRLLSKLLRLEPDHFEGRATFAEINKQPFVKARATPEIPKGVPLWAYNAREVLRANLRISHWWHDNRLMEDGQLGGDWNDDPTLTAYQSLGAAIGDPTTLALIQKVADGYVENSGQYRDGFNIRPTDPLHSSDPTAGRCNLLTFDYGSGRNVYRSMECSRNLKTWIPKNENGTRSLVGYHMAAGTAEGSPWNGSYVHAIFSDPVAWAWYSGDPNVRQMMLDVADTWLNAGQEYWAKHPEQRNISVSVNGLTGEWKPGGTSGQAFREQFFHSAYVLSGDRRYLIPIERRRILPSLYFRETPVKEWGASFKSNADTILSTAERDRSSFRYEYRNDSVFALSYVETGDKKYLSEGLRLALEELQAGQEYLNSSAEKPTDRVFPCVGSNLLGEMFCGGYLPDTRTALVGSFRASWEGLGDQVIPVIVEQSPKGLRIVLYSFAATEREIGLRTWRLERGDYELILGFDTDRNDRIDKEYSRQAIKDVRRGNLAKITVKPGLSVIELSQKRALPALGRMPDLAVDATFIKYNPLNDTLEAKVYNLGSQAAEDVTIRMLVNGRVVKEKSVERIEWPEDFHPKPIVIEYPQGATLDSKEITVQVSSKGDEITLENNSVTVAWPPR